MKTHGGNLNAYYEVKETYLKEATYYMISTI